jgi:hypothetical protein
MIATSATSQNCKKKKKKKKQKKAMVLNTCCHLMLNPSWDVSQ